MCEKKNRNRLSCRERPRRRPIVKCMIQVVTNSHKYSGKAIHCCLHIFFSVMRWFCISCRRANIGQDRFDMKKQRLFSSKKSFSPVVLLQQSHFCICIKAYINNKRWSSGIQRIMIKTSASSFFLLTERETSQLISIFLAISGTMPYHTTTMAASWNLFDFMCFSCWNS